MKTEKPSEKRSMTKLGVAYKPPTCNYSTLGPLKCTWVQVHSFPFLCFKKKPTTGTTNETPPIKSNQGCVFRVNSAPLLFLSGFQLPISGLSAVVSTSYEHTISLERQYIRIPRCDSSEFRQMVLGHIH